MTKRDYNNSIAALYVPVRIRRLPIDERGFPVPWFVSWFKNGIPAPNGEGEPDFRYGSVEKQRFAITKDICWVCGSKLGRYRAFTIGPMCCVNRVSAEPPAHQECAEFSVKGCPFLNNPRMRRNEAVDKPFEGQGATPGIMLAHNPGVILIWTAKTYELMRQPGGAHLFKLHEPTGTAWYCQGREATRQEALAAMKIGFPMLAGMAKKEGPDATTMLLRQLLRAEKYLPAGEEDVIGELRRMTA